MLEDDVRKALEAIRPKLETDGGGIELVSVGNDGKGLSWKGPASMTILPVTLLNDHRFIP